MHRVIRSVTAAFVTMAVVTPSLDVAQAAGANKQPQNTGRAAVEAKDTTFIDRQEKMWGRLSASICSGCITAANRVAPSSYEKPGSMPVAEAKLETVKTAVRTAATPRRFVQLKKRYAKHNRRERLRLAARARLRTAMLAKRRALHVAALKRRHPAPARAAFVPAYEARSINTVYRIPTDQPFTPRDDGRWHETILPTALRMRRG